MVPVDGPVRHVTLSRVLVLALVPSVVALALSIYNTNRVNQDRAQRRAQIDAEICAVVARIPGPGIPDFERVIGCPVTEPIPLPTVTPTPTSAPGPVSARSSLPRPSDTGSLPVGVAAAALRRSATPTTPLKGARVVIAYDQPIVDMIAGLNATGHVTHRSWPKTSVTLHHNARVGASHQDILDGWKARPSSAHFDVDNAGAPAQYVVETEYAWAVGNTAGNQSSISIEMANSGGGPDWPVSEVTWRSAARLAGWLFAHVIHARPTTTSLLPHRHWSATACPGPYALSVFGQILTAAQAAYDEFTAPPRAPHTQTAPLPAQEDDDMPAILTTPEGAFLLLSGRFYEHLTPSDLESVAPASSSGSTKPISADLHAKLKAWAAK